MQKSEISRPVNERVRVYAKGGQQESQASARTPSGGGCTCFLSDGSDSVIFENYDFTDYGYLRILANDTQLRIEYHPASDGEDSKTPDDFVTVDLATRKIAHFRGF